MKPYWVVYKYDGNLFYNIYIIVIFIYIYLKLIKNTHTLLVCVFFVFMEHHIQEENHTYV